MKKLDELINDYRKYFSYQMEEMIDKLSKDNFKAFLLGMECAALYANDMKYYSEVMSIIDRYREEMKK